MFQIIVNARNRLFKVVNTYFNPSTFFVSEIQTKFLNNICSERGQYDLSLMNFKALVYCDML